VGEGKGKGGTMKDPQKNLKKQKLTKTLNIQKPLKKPSYLLQNASIIFSESYSCCRTLLGTNKKAIPSFSIK
jgi:hypothetical protein